MSSQGVMQGVSMAYLKTIGIVNNGDNGRGFANPYDVAVSRDGRIFVLNRCDPARATAIRVGICTLDEEYKGEFGNGFGTGDGQFGLPVAMAFDSGERLYVTDEYLHRISIFDSSGAFAAKWGAMGSGDGELNGPAGIAIDGSDNVYVADQNNHRVQKFTADGKYVAQWGEKGSGNGQFNMPWGLCAADGHVYVADWRNDRIQKFSSDGTFVTSFGSPGDGNAQFSRPSGVAVDADGNIYVADWGNERVQVLAADGSFQQLLRGEATLSKWALDFFEVNPDEKETRAQSNLTPPLPPHLETPYLISSQTEPYFWGPVSVTVDAANRLYVVETNRHRLQVYQRN